MRYCKTPLEVHRHKHVVRFRILGRHVLGRVLEGSRGFDMWLPGYPAFKGNTVGFLESMLALERRSPISS